MKLTTHIILAAVILLSSQSSVFAYDVVQGQNIPVENTFVVGPVKMETEIAPGESKEVFFLVQNRTGRTQSFTISFEDFVASSNEGQTVEFLADDRSDMSLRDWLSVSEKSFTLLHGESVRVPVIISAEIGAEAGGRFGAVIVSAASDDVRVGSGTRASTGAVVLGRVASLLFVTVSGDVEKNGELVSFETKSKRDFFMSGDVEMRIGFENKSSVSLNPYGVITVKNTVTRATEETILDPWYVLPGSTRTRDVSFQNLSSGMYTATLELNRGYDDVVDTKSISFIVVTPLCIGGILIVILGLVLIGRRLYRRSNVS
jgi:hypothetical protein